VGKIGPLQLSGFPAWVVWAGVHIAYLIGFRNRLLVLMQWAWKYLTYQRGARLITRDPRDTHADFRRAQAAQPAREATNSSSAR
jgi:hypothetical protein